HWLASVAFNKALLLVAFCWVRCWGLLGITHRRARCDLLTTLASQCHTFYVLSGCRISVATLLDPAYVVIATYVD
ncbi:MAG: hypothetical protein AAF497_06710, partial [Planctomycetota bacterium]